MLTLAICSLLVVPTHVDDPIAELEPTVVAHHEAALKRLVLGRKGKVLYTIEGDPQAAAKTAFPLFEMQAWDLDKGKVLWSTELKGPAVVGLDVGEDIIVANMGFMAAPSYSVEDGAHLNSIGAPNVMDKATCIAVDPKDRWVWIGASNGVLSRVDPTSVDGWAKRGSGNDGVTCLAMDAKGKKLAIGGSDGTVRFVDPSGGQVDKKKVFEVFENGVSAMIYYPKGSKLIVGAADGGLQVIDAGKGKRSLELVGHDKKISALAVDGKRKWIASGDAKGSVRLWDYKSGETVATLKGEATGAVAGLVFDSKRKRLLGTCGGKELLAWDLSEL